jgi:hypothetical protein
VISHTDWDSIVFNSSNRELNRRVVSAYASTPQEWMSSADPYMGRRLRGLIRKSSLQLVDVKPFVSIDLTFRPGFSGLPKSP